MNVSWQTLLAVGSGGFIGASLRFYVGVVVAKNFPNDIPLATLSVNIVGSFLIGILIAIFLTYTPSHLIKLFLITGFLGALTTYSTFAIESFFLLNSSLWLGILNIMLNLFGSLIAVASGYKLIELVLTQN
ncbi:MAG: fluoride efflux transporter CrcB [Arcobacteraceae bacterium]|nr:fluoride efflux transporter CrcB [Arcobacteraceae bacterium]